MVRDNTEENIRTYGNSHELANILNLVATCGDPQPFELGLDLCHREGPLFRHIGRLIIVTTKHHFVIAIILVE